MRQGKGTERLLQLTPNPLVPLRVNDINNYTNKWVFSVHEQQKVE